MRRLFITCCLIVLLYGDKPASAFIENLMNRLQKQMMDSWQRMRDQRTRPRRIAEMYLDIKPVFVQTVDSAAGKLDLAINGLNRSNYHYTLFRVTNITDWLSRQDNIFLEPMAQGLGEINAVNKVEDDMIVGNGVPYWYAASNFYAPQNVEGHISFIPCFNAPSNTSSRNPLTLTSDEGQSEWYYSTVEWVDMNQDGWPDIVTSRSRGRPGSIQVSELIWIENPGYSFFFRNNMMTWRHHPITHGPDVSIRVLRIPLPSGESRLVIVGAGYWDHKLYIVWTEDPLEDWTNIDAIKERVIDNHGWFFDLQVADVNADGRVDVVATTWSYGAKKGSVFVYEIPCEFIAGKWKRHVLIDGSADLDRPDESSGGKISIFHPYLRYGQITRKKKPFIIVSGDDDGKVYVLIPSSRKTNNWDYTSQTIYKTRGPVGAATVDDMNHDGYMEIVIPVKDSMKLIFFSYEPGEFGSDYFVDES